MKYLFWVIIFLNIISFVLMGIDKMKAKSNKFRISESTLLILGLFGAFGFSLGMILFHHKFSKPKFRYLCSVFLTSHLILVGMYVYHLMQF